MNIDSGNTTSLVLLDLSDTLDHNGIIVLWLVRYFQDCSRFGLFLSIGSYLRPLLVTLYTTPPGSVISRHLYTDDTQIFISLSKTNAELLLSLGQQCIQDVSDWIIATKLKFSLD